MSHGRAFLLSSFVHDDEADTEDAHNKRRQDTRTAAPPFQTADDRNESGRDDDDDDYDADSISDEHDGYGPVEVFYDQHAGMSAWETNRKNRSQDEPATAPAASVFRDGHTTAPNMSITEGNKQEEQQKTTSKTACDDRDCQAGDPLRQSDAPTPHQRRSTKRAALRQYVGFVNTAVATMDHAVSVPAALRGAGRRTMFDVLVEVAQRRKEKLKEGEGKAAQVDATTRVSSRSTNVSSAPGGSAAATSLSAVRSARDATYRMLFPAAATAAAVASAAVGGNGRPFESSTSPSHLQTSALKRHDRASAGHQRQQQQQHELPVMHSTPNLPPGGGSSVSHTTLATTAGSSPMECIHDARPHVDPALTSSTTGSATSLYPVGEGGAQRTSSASAAATPPQSGPDRRLRHLLPAHLHGAVSAQKKGDGPSAKVGSRALRKGGEEQARENSEDDDSASDISSVSSGEQPPRRAAQRVAVRPASEEDACLRDFLDGGGGGGGKRETGLNLSLSTRASMKGKATSKEETTWLQRLEETVESTRQRAAADQSLLEEVLMGHRARRPASPEEQLPRGHRRPRDRATGAVQVGDDGAGSMTAASTCSTSRSRSSGSKSRSQSSSARSTSFLSDDLMRDIDDDVPQWVLQREARQQRQRQPQYELDLRGPRAGVAERSSAVLEQERVEVLQSFIGKPTTFCPSCAASRRPPNRKNSNPPPTAAALHSTSNAPSRFQCYTSAGTTASSFFASAAQATGSLFLASWKEGKRLCKHNPTATSVVAYLSDCFDRWKPYGLQLQQHTHDRDSLPTGASTGDENSGDGDVSISSADDAPVLPYTSKTHRGVHAGEGNYTGKAAATALDAKRKECGVELKIRVQYIEAAFNVAVVHGTLVWCSEHARQRLRMSPISGAAAASEGAICTVDEEDNRHTLLRPLQAAPLPSSAFSDVGDLPWTFLFPEPALMQIQALVGEHLYIAHPYHVYSSQRIVLASYNFTTDAVVRQQEAQFALELEERLRVVSKRSEGGNCYALPAHHGEVADLDSRRHRGMSPVRTSAHPALYQSERSPTHLCRPSHAGTATAAATTVADRSPHRLVYEIPGRSSTPQRPASAQIQSSPDASLAIPAPSDSFTIDAEAHTPERTPKTLHVVDASPAPHPPFHEQSQQRQQRPGSLATTAAVQHEKGNADGTGPYAAAEYAHPPECTAASLHKNHNESYRPWHSVDPATSAAPLPSFVRTSTTVSPSVNSLAADGFYDPLAMPSFHATTTTASAVAAAVAAASMHGDGGVTMVLTGNSADAYGEDSRMVHRYSRAAAPSDLVETSSPYVAGATATANALKPPPPFRPFAGAPADVDEHARLQPFVNAAGTGMTGEPVRTFGGGDTAVEDRVGHGFPRGPPLDWDVPVEVLFALSGLASQRASKALTEPRPSQGAQPATATVHTFGSQRCRDAEGLQETPPRKRARAREDVRLAEDERDALPVVSRAHEACSIPPTPALPKGECHEVMSDGGCGRTLMDVSCSLPTPLPSEVEKPLEPVSPARSEDSLSCSISSPSDLSDDPADHGKDRAPSPRNAGVLTERHRFRPSSAAAPPPGRSLPRRGGGGGTPRSLRQQRTEMAGTQVASRSGAPMHGVARYPVESEVTAGEAVHRQVYAYASQVQASPPPGATSTLFSGEFGALGQPREADAEATAATTAPTTGFYAFNDVVLSDSDE
ncbi:hypothetical protein ABB37_02645 [Leptomonas pyrrhocoris]|uniref:Uncharacterized protein n=1 Tax=Leptomonas pyrrhocoris TaxID=157538 RepID=A0A0M9G5Z4_LEPPY|nr:hypothetical protein ABB37_02645 [Leptomonas pyrrhocoris]KPA82886.1 hypothetical protein ABB37_02645 [Leptomonas pyrrhocoris]|eukprot:XP_015661325.1 hypothetical protein ABB37_02645 [Leptomonas pyrrhocoris]